MTVRFIGNELWSGGSDFPEDIVVINVERNHVIEELEKLHDCEETVVISSSLTPGFFRDSGQLTEDTIHLVHSGDSLVFGIPDGKNSDDYGPLVRSIAGSMGCRYVKITDHRTSELISYLIAVRKTMDIAFSDLAHSLSEDNGSSIEAIVDAVGIQSGSTYGDSGIDILLTDETPALIDGIIRSDTEMRRRFIDDIMSDGTKSIGFLNMDEGVIRDMANAVRKNGGKCIQIGTAFKGIKRMDDASAISDFCQVIISSGEPDAYFGPRVIHWK